jgi:hypothetical protein
MPDWSKGRGMKKALLLAGILLLLPLSAGADSSPHEDAKKIVYREVI